MTGPLLPALGPGDPPLKLSCERCESDCSDNPFLLVHDDGSTDGPVCQRCATILNGGAR